MGKVVTLVDVGNFFSKETPALGNIARRICGDRDEAMDAVQHAALACTRYVLEARLEVPEGSNATERLRRFAIRVLRNHAIDQRRHAARLVHFDVDPPASDAQSWEDHPEARAEERRRMDQIESLLPKLTEKQREILARVAWGEADTAVALTQGERQLLRRARARLAPARPAPARFDAEADLDKAA